MRLLVAIAVLLVVALAGFLLLPDQPADSLSPINEHPAQTDQTEAVDAIDVSEQLIADNDSAEEEPPIEDCYEDYGEQMQRLETEVLTEELADQIVEEARSNWSGSASLELKVFAAQLLDEYDESVKLFARELEQPVTSPYFLWSAVNMCLANLEYHTCPIEDWLERLIAVDSENSLVWIRAAGYYHSTGDLRRAKAALDQAAIAYEANDYWFENIMNAKAGIDVVGGFSDRVGYLLAIQVATMYPSRRVLYERMCKEMPAKDAEWLSSCVAYGEHVSQITTRERVRENAENLQAEALIASGESADSARVVALLESPPAFSAKELYRYPDSAAIYMSAMASSGAIAAGDVLLAEHDRRRSEGIEPECGDINMN